MLFRFQNAEASRDTVHHPVNRYKRGCHVDYDLWYQKVDPANCEARHFGAYVRNAMAFDFREKFSGRPTRPFTDPP